jgi:heme oxygenase
VDSEINTLEKASVSEGLSTSQNQNKLKKIAISEKKGIVDNRKIRALQDSVDQNHQQFIKRIKIAISNLEQLNNNEALRNLVHAQEIEEDSRKLLKDIRKLHKQLMQITKNEKHTVKEMA